MSFLLSFWAYEVLKNMLPMVAKSSTLYFIRFSRRATSDVPTSGIVIARSYDVVTEGNTLVQSSVNYFHMIQWTRQKRRPYICLAILIMVDIVGVVFCYLLAMTTITLTNPIKALSWKFENERDLYQYLVDHVIDIDIREHDISEFDPATQQLISSIADKPMTSFINIA